MNIMLWRSIFSILLVSAVGGGHVFAQSSDTEPVQLDEISVTAQRREEQMQKIPLSMSVISGQALDRMQVRRVDDLKFTTPNVIIEQNTGTTSGAKIVMRGVGADESMFTTDPAVALYIDDVYIARANGALFDLYDVARIETLRGPQGTLYGRNATSGAIRYISKKPTGEDRLIFDGSFGNFGRMDGRMMLSTRLGERLDMSVSALRRSRDGIMHDISHDRWVSDQDVWAGRLAFAGTWGEASYATLSLDRLRDRSTPAWGTPVMRGEHDRVIPRLGSFYRTQTDTLGINALDQFGVVLTSETDFGAFSWRNILHYRALDHHFYMDVDGTEQMRYHLEQEQQQNQRGYEAQFTSQGDGVFNWVAGIFTFWEHNDQPTRNDIFVRGGTNHVRQDTTAYAIYMQADYKFAEALTLTLGGRYSYEQKEFSIRAVTASGEPNFSRKLERSWSRPDWKALLSWDINEDVMAYASVTTGFKSGGFNGRGTSFDTIVPVDAETLRAYEIGVKSSWLNQRLRLNADYYRLDYAGIQLTSINPDGIFVMNNATGALIQGIELDMQAQLSRRLRLEASLGTINDKYQHYSEINADYFRGRSMKGTPDMQWTLAATWIESLAYADIVFSAQARHTDEYYQNQDTSRLIMTRANTEYNARISWEPHHANWSVALWGKNLSNTMSSTGGFDIANLGISTIYPNVPRTYGVDFKYRFW